MIEVVCLAQPKWCISYLASTTELMKQISVENRVLYIDYHRTILDVLNKPSKEVNKRSLGIKKRWKKDKDTIVWSLPPIIPINWISNKGIYALLAKFNGWIIGKSISHAVKKFNFTRYYYINAFTPIYGLTSRNYLKPISEIYYCYDEISASDWCKKHGQWAEEKFIEVVNKVIVTSQELYLNKSKLHKNVYLLRNGVDFEIFNKFLDLSKNKQPKKIIGYVGTIDKRLDYSLLHYLINELKNYEFWFIGRGRNSKAEKLKEYSNVKFLGTLSKNELAKKINLIHVGIIPFVKNNFTKNVYPLKANEYLAAGCAVISTNFADLSDLKNIISISTDYTSFLNECKKALNDLSSDEILQRNQFAKKNSWSNKGQELLTIITDD